MLASSSALSFYGSLLCAFTLYKITFKFNNSIILKIVFQTIWLSNFIYDLYVVNLYLYKLNILIVFLLSVKILIVLESLTTKIAVRIAIISALINDS